MKRKCIDCGREFDEEKMVQDGTIFIPGDWYCEKCFEDNCEYEEDQGIR
jgi:uncharacterized OB-fold protein